MKKVKTALSLGALAAIGFSACFAALSQQPKMTEVRADYPIDAQTNPGPSLTTMRLWFVCDGSNIWNEGGIAVGVNTPDWKVYIPVGVTNYNSKNYFYIDIPTESISFKVLRTNGDHTTAYNESAQQTGINPNLVYYINEYDYSWSISSGASRGDSQPSAAMLAKVLEGYNTCEESDKNGYLAYPTLKSTWWDNYAGDVDGTKNNTYLDDFPSQDSSGTKSATVSVANKWKRMGDEYEAYQIREGLLGAAKTVASTSNNKAIYIIIATTVAALIGAGVFFLLRKRANN